MYGVLLLVGRKQSGMVELASKQAKKRKRTKTSQ